MVANSTDVDPSLTLVNDSEVTKTVLIENVTARYLTSHDDGNSKLAGIVQSLWETVPLVLITFGTIGNLVTISVLLRKKLRVISSVVYLIALTVTDLLILYLGLFRRWLKYTIDFDMRVAMGCGPHIWLLYSALAFSSWILVALTMERVISVKFPLFSRGGFSRMSAITVVLILGLLVAGFNSLFIFAYRKVVKYSDSPPKQNSTAVSVDCQRTPEMTDLVTVWLWLDLSLSSLTPFLFLLVGNTCIAYEMISHRKQSEQAYPKLYHYRPITKLLILLSVMFAATTLPIRITICLVPSTSPLWDSEVFNLWWAIANLIMYTNNTINFILYSSFGTNFRTELQGMFSEMSTSVRKKFFPDKAISPKSFDNILYETEDVPVHLTGMKHA